MTRIDWREHPATQDTLKYRKYRVLLDGADVTSGCFLADDETGEVGRYLRDDSGHYYQLGSDAAQEFRSGNVEIRPPAE